MSSISGVLPSALLLSSATTTPMSSSGSGGTGSKVILPSLTSFSPNQCSATFPKLCPASLWALAHCMNKQRFTFGTVVGTDNLRCHPTFKGQFEDYLRTVKRVDPAEYEVITIASCTGHSFVYTREIPEGESEDIEYLTPRSYARLGSICHGTHIGNAQSILRQGLDVDYGVKTGLARRNMIHFCPSTNELPLKRQGLYCYLDLKVAITISASG